jgi:hypothetical protein
VDPNGDAQVVPEGVGVLLDTEAFARESKDGKLLLE